MIRAHQAPAALQFFSARHTERLRSPRRALSSLRSSSSSSRTALAQLRNQKIKGGRHGGGGERCGDVNAQQLVTGRF